MKCIIVGLVAVLLSSGLQASAENGIRVFTDEQGRAVEARIVSVDSVKGTIQLEREDGQRFWVSPKRFSADDQTYIRQWADANRVLSEKSLRISFKKKRLESFNRKKMGGVANGFSKGEVICYEVTLTNRSKRQIVGLRLESMYFVRVSSRNHETIKHVGPGTGLVSLIEPGKSVTLRTTKLTLEEKFNRIAVSEPGTVTLGYDENKISEDELMGIWLKIYGPEVDGERVVRDVCEPSGLDGDVEWVEDSER